MSRANALKTLDAGAGEPNMRKSKPADHVQYHKDGSVWARGRTIDGVATGYWEWFRKDGVRMRSGTFERGAQVGQWTTYDKSGAVYKVTSMKPKPKPKPRPKKRIKAIARELRLSRGTVRRIVRSGETAPAYERKEQPLSKTN